MLSPKVGIDCSFFAGGCEHKAHRASLCSKCFEKFHVSASQHNQSPLNGLHKRCIPRSGQLFVPCIVRMHPITGVSCRIKSCPAVNHNDRTLGLVLGSRPFRNRLVERHDSISALRAVGRPHGNDLSNLPSISTRATIDPHPSGLNSPRSSPPSCSPSSNRPSSQTPPKSPSGSYYSTHHSSPNHPTISFPPFPLPTTRKLTKCIITKSGLDLSNQPGNSLLETIPVARMPPCPSFAPSYVKPQP